MTITAVRRNRKGTNEQIIRLNSIGLSLATIANKLSCHPTSITLRLKSLHISAADTRRTFMEDIYNTLDPSFQEQVADILTAGDTAPKSIKNYVKELLVNAVEARNAREASETKQTALETTSEEPI